MTIHEPSTLLTDYMLAALGAVCGWRLHRSGSAANVSRRWWSRAMWCSGVGAWIGGSYHGFGPMLSTAWSDALWSATLVVLCLTSAAMALALVHEVAPAAQRRRWQLLVWAKFAGFASLAVALPVFLTAIADYGAVMLALAAAALFVRRTWRAPIACSTPTRRSVRGWRRNARCSTECWAMPWRFLNHPRLPKHWAQSSWHRLRLRRSPSRK